MTMTPKGNEKAGYVIKKKKELNIKQIWADSLYFSFSKLRKIDVIYIDGNHHYKWVYSDLVNSSKIARKMIMIDDYIPSRNSKRDVFVQWAPYFEEVVHAVTDFIRYRPQEFKKAYYLEGTRICVLLK